eukprot:TRINITY_DN26454_c0_g1_i1.p2 TRINITY_DN26454_c0_g1~~TRINITY_DN26454_c0_g1_i1.p2  ORF type:complete len:479 (+),score=175.03 TRINITY_DN26454_c0_g1_i1:43-1437(+)
MAAAVVLCAFGAAVCDSGRVPDGWTVVSQAEPRVLVNDDFASSEEVDRLLRVANAQELTPAEIFSAEEGASVGVRESRNVFLSIADEVGNPTMRAVKLRMAEAAGLPPEAAEPLQVNQYAPGGHYVTHLDASEQHERPATLLLYLTDAEEGGETFFPNATRSDHSTAYAKAEAAAVCSGRPPGAIFVAPRKGRAVLFWNWLPDGAGIDDRSRHGSCPLVRGTKTTLQQWFSVPPYWRPYLHPNAVAVWPLARVLSDELGTAGKLSTPSKPLFIQGVYGAALLAPEGCCRPAAAAAVAERIGSTGEWTLAFWVVLGNKPDRALPRRAGRMVVAEVVADGEALLSVAIGPGGELTVVAFGQQSAAQKRLPYGGKWVHLTVSAARGGAVSVHRIDGELTPQSAARQQRMAAGAAAPAEGGDGVRLLCAGSPKLPFGVQELALFAAALGGADDALTLAKQALASKVKK